jgi:hypothetical protein
VTNATEHRTEALPDGEPHLLPGRTDLAECVTETRLAAIAGLGPPTRGMFVLRWNWEEIDVARSGSSGDVSKLFRNEPQKNPGVLGADPAEGNATVMAREVIQNSWDAAHDLRATLGSEPAPPFEVRFRFDRLEEPRRGALIKNLDLRALASRAANQADRAGLGLPESSCLERLDEAPLALLTIEERGTSGMYGPWKGDSSKMYLALVSIGFTVKHAGAGGSYGYGKAGLIRGSRTRTVVAYSCFREQATDPGVTRRLLGMTYWGPHKADERSFSGFARLGQELKNGSVKPYEDEAADEVAASLGLPTRSADDASELGTTFVVIDPSVDPGELKRAIERNWWPALRADPTFRVDVTGYKAERLEPDPESSAELKAFVRAFDLVVNSGTQPTADEKRFVFQHLKLGDERLDLGTLALVGERDGWSYPADDGIEHRSLVALTRGPRMIVEYLDAGGAKPFVRGTFVAHEDVDDLLRQTETRAHDAWQTRVGDDSVHPDAPKVAKAVLQRIKNNVGSFRNALKPPKPNPRAPSAGAGEALPVGRGRRRAARAITPTRATAARLDRDQGAGPRALLARRYQDASHHRVPPERPRGRGEPALPTRRPVHLLGRRPRGRGLRPRHRLAGRF